MTPSPKTIQTLATRWAPTSYKWSYFIPYNPYQWPSKWVTGVISPYLHETFHPIYNHHRGPTLCHHLTVSSPTSRMLSLRSRLPVLNAMLCRFNLMDLYGLEGTKAEGKWFSRCMYTMGPQNLYFCRVFMVDDNLAFKWPKSQSFMVFGSHGTYG